MKRKVLSVVLTLAMALSLLPTAAQAATYSDVPEKHWAASAIDRWSDYGVVTGDQGKFRPDADMTRAEAAAVFARLLALTDDTASKTFSDLPANHWAYSAMNKVINAGIITGSDTGKALPDAKLDRQTFFIMFARALGMKAQDTTSSTLVADGDFWANGYINALTDKGYIAGADLKGDGNLSVNAKGSLTRASVMKLLDQTITVYANENGKTYEGTGKGVLLVTADDCTITGKVDTLVIAGDAENVDTSAVETKADGSVSGTLTLAAGKRQIKLVNAIVALLNLVSPKTSVDIGAGSAVTAVALTAQADAAEIAVAAGASVETLETAAADTAIENSGVITSVEVAETATGAAVTAAAGSYTGLVETKASGTAVSGAGAVANVVVSGSAASGTSAAKVETKGTKTATVDSTGKTTTATTSGSLPAASSANATAATSAASKATAAASEAVKAAETAATGSSTGTTPTTGGGSGGGSTTTPSSALTFAISPAKRTGESDEENNTMLGKSASELGTDLAVSTSGTTVTVTGTLNYVDGWTTFSSEATLQKGFYLPLKITTASSVSESVLGDAKIVVKGKTEKTITGETFFTNGDYKYETLKGDNLVMHVSGKDTLLMDKFTITVDLDGNGTTYSESTYTVDLSKVNAQISGSSVSASTTNLVVPANTTLTIASGASLTVSGDATINGKVVLNGEATLSGGLDHLSGSGSVVISKTATLNVGSNTAAFFAPSGNNDSDGTRITAANTTGAITLDIAAKKVTFGDGTKPVYATIYTWPSDWAAEIKAYANVTVNSLDSIKDVEKTIAVDTNGILSCMVESASVPIFTNDEATDEGTYLSAGTVTLNPSKGTVIFNSGATAVIKGWPDDGYQLVVSSGAHVKHDSTKNGQTNNGNELAAGSYSWNSTSKMFADASALNFSIATGTYFNQPASDLGSNLKVTTDEYNTVTVTGTLNYVSPYTDFSSATDEQSGYYLPLNLARPSGVTAFENATLSSGPVGSGDKYSYTEAFVKPDSDPKTYEDHQLIMLVGNESKMADSFDIIIDWDGSDGNAYAATTYTVDLSAVTRNVVVASEKTFTVSADVKPETITVQSGGTLLFATQEVADAALKTEGMTVTVAAGAKLGIVNGNNNDIILDGSENPNTSNNCVVTFTGGSIRLTGAEKGGTLTIAEGVTATVPSGKYWTTYFSVNGGTPYNVVNNGTVNINGTMVVAEGSTLTGIFDVKGTGTLSFATGKAANAAFRTDGLTVTVAVGGKLGVNGYIILDGNTSSSESNDCLVTFGQVENVPTGSAAWPISIVGNSKGGTLTISKYIAATVPAEKAWTTYFGNVEAEETETAYNVVVDKDATLTVIGTMAVHPDSTLTNNGTFTCTGVLALLGEDCFKNNGTITTIHKVSFNSEVETAQKQIKNLPVGVYALATKAAGQVADDQSAHYQMLAVFQATSGTTYVAQIADANGNVVYNEVYTASDNNKHFFYIAIGSGAAAANNDENAWGDSDWTVNTTAKYTLTNVSEAASPSGYVYNWGESNPGWTNYTLTVKTCTATPVSTD